MFSEKLHDFQEKNIDLDTDLNPQKQKQKIFEKFKSIQKINGFAFMEIRIFPDPTEKS